jgi:hypothetical protein
MNGDPIFLTLAEALEIHKNQIECYGGGLRGQSRKSQEKKQKF